jgi:hypothetical protein
MSSESQGFLSSIRLKIASTLTSALTPNEKDKLFDSLGIKVSKEDTQELERYRKENLERDKIDTSIGEAVAAAVAKEAAKAKSLAEAQRQKIWEQAEKATKNRLELEMQMKERQLAMERWELEIEAEKRAKEAESTVEEEESVTEISDDDHPVLGPTLVDLGYKRIHVTSAQNLSAIPIWEKQRVYRHGRAKSMATDKMKSLELGLPGVISLHESPDGKLSILDGQHRVGMLTILQTKKKTDASSFDMDQILVEVFPQPSTEFDSHAKDIFTEINKAEPVKLVDMPGVATRTDRRIINEAASTISEMYPDMFKPSQRCRAPHLNIDNLRDNIFAAEIIKKHNIKNEKGLVKWMMSQNEALGQQIEKEGTSKKINATALKKAKKFEFYLGLDMAWLYK